MSAIACPPKVGWQRRNCCAVGWVSSPKISNGTLGAAALLREGSISVRLLCVMLFYRYLKFFLDMGTGTAFGGARRRTRERRRKEEAPLRREADGHAILPDFGFPWPQCPTGPTQAQSESGIGA